MGDTEKAFIRGRRSMATRVLHALMSDLDLDDRSLVTLTGERDEAVARLRDLSEELGCNDWPDDLHLADVIEKHVGRAVLALADGDSEATETEQSAELYLRWLRLAERIRGKGWRPVKDYRIAFGEREDDDNQYHHFTIEARDDRGSTRISAHAEDLDHDSAFRLALERAEGAL